MHLELVMRRDSMRCFCNLMQKTYERRYMPDDTASAIAGILDTTRDRPLGLATASVCPYALRDIVEAIGYQIPWSEMSIEDAYSFIHVEMVVNEFFALTRGEAGH